MPDGKPAGVRCIHLTQNNLCGIHGSKDYPDVCRKFRPSQAMCGQNKEQAMRNLAKMEMLTRPDSIP
jgi:hypothetical protein